MKTTKGDIFKVGDHVIACGDSLDRAFVGKVIGNRTGSERSSLTRHTALRMWRTSKDSSKIRSDGRDESDCERPSSE
jgi:hypothetical protein